MKQYTRLQAIKLLREKHAEAIRETFPEQIKDPEMRRLWIQARSGLRAVDELMAHIVELDNDEFK